MELDEQIHNKYTSLKSLFKSTDPSKHFHGNKPKKFNPGKDQPDPSKAKLISTSNSKNTPASFSFKDKLLHHYRENFSEINEDNSTRIYHNAQTANYANAGIHLYARGTNPQIKKLDNKFAKREKQITGSDSVKHSRDALMKDINAEHEKNYVTTHHQQHHPEPIEQRLQQHKLNVKSVVSKFMPKKHNVSSQSMHNPKIIANKQDSTAVYHPSTSPAVHIDTTPSHSVSHPTPVSPVARHPVAIRPVPHRNK